MVRYGDVPVVDYCMLTHFSQALSLQPLFNAAPLDTILMQAKPLSLVDLDHTATQHDAFEAFAFNVLVAFAVYFYHEQPDQKYVPEGRWTKQLTNWMPEGPATFKFCGPLGSSKPNRHPFTSTKGDRLSEEFNEKLRMLQEMDDAIFLHCGGEAKLDFLLVKVIAVDEESTVRTLTVRFADAKHAEGTTAVSSADCVLLRRPARKAHDKGTESTRRAALGAAERLQPFRLRSQACPHGDEQDPRGA